MVMKRQAIAAIIIVLAIIGGGSIYMVQQQKPLPTSSPTPTVAPTLTPTPTSTPTPAQSPKPTPTPTPTQSAAEEARVRSMVMAYYAAFNNHSETHVASFFTGDGQKLINHGQDGMITGQKELMTHFSNIFTYCYGRTIRKINITQLQIDGDKATVQVKYEDYSPESFRGCGTLNITENMQLTRMGDTWKITRTDLEFITPKRD
jgi:ketosteroid isomerase-like protein